MRRVIACALVVLPFARTLPAQETTAEHFNAWLMVFGNHRLSERWGVHTEYQWRRNEGVEHWQQSLLRLGVDHYTKAGPVLSAGYGWIRSFPYGEQPAAYPSDEHRIWEQLILTHAAGAFQFHHRYRLEQRFIEQQQLGSDGDYEPDDPLFKQRVRYRFLFTLPLSRRELADRTLFLCAYDEVFLQFGANAGVNILDQNRLYAALGWRVDRNRNVQLGYLNQYIVKTDGVHTERNHTLQVALTWNLDFRKGTATTP